MKDIPQHDIDAEYIQVRLQEIIDGLPHSKLLKCEAEMILRAYAYTEAQKRTIELQANELRSVERDAARWDYCRSATPDLERFCGCTAGELDRAIDAAIAEQAKGTP